jgi:hypothetical protein
MVKDAKDNSEQATSAADDSTAIPELTSALKELARVIAEGTPAGSPQAPGSPATERAAKTFLGVQAALRPDAPTTKAKSHTPSA